MGTSRDVAPNFYMADGSVGPDHLVHKDGVLLLGVGNPLLDISCKVPMDVLEKYGVKSGDIILAEDRHATLYDELVAQYAPEYIAGGAKLAECARAGGVEVAYQVDAEAPTGVCGVLVDPTNERTLVTRLDAANNFTKDHLETAAVQKLLVASKVVYSAGFFLTSGGPDCTALLGQHCADFGKRFCLNISAPFIAQFFGEALDATMPFVDILFANETEAAALGEARGWGSDATIVACEGAVTTYPVTPLAKELLVDTNGAGDAFVGGFLSRLVLGEGWDACVKAGHYAARE